MFRRACTQREHDLAYCFRLYGVICHQAKYSLYYEIEISLVFEKATVHYQKRLICCSFSLNIDLFPISFLLLRNHDRNRFLTLLQSMSKNDLVPKGAQSQAQSHDTSGTHIEKSLMIPNKADQRSKEAEPLNNIAVATPPSAPGSPAPGEKIINAGNRQYSPTSLETLLRESSYTKLPNSYDLPMLWSASRDPPITRATLSELDLQRLYHSLYLRHDLHFDRHIQFSPRSAYDTFGKQKRLEAQNYWDAVEIELALYAS